MSGPDLDALEGLIRDSDGEPVFSEPWEAQAFAMALALHRKGVFTWGEWADALSTQIHGGTDRPYFRHWLAALESLMAQNGLATPEEVASREKAWHEAAARTPHGEPIEL